MRTDDKPSPAEMQNVKLESIEQGKELIADIEARQQQLLGLMQGEGSIPAWQKLSDERYELKKAKRHLINEMGKLFKSGRVARAARQQGGHA